MVWFRSLQWSVTIDEDAKDIDKFLSVSIVAAGFTLGVARVGNAAANDSSDAVLATVGSMKITEAQVDEKARPQLSAIQSQVYTAKKRALDDIIDDYLIEQAAKKAGISKDAYHKARSRGQGAGADRNGDEGLLRSEPGAHPPAL